MSVLKLVQQEHIVLNMTCFIKCPDYTVENEEENPPYTCSCNKEIDAYWYKFEQGEQTFYVCRC